MIGGRRRADSRGERHDWPPTRKQEGRTERSWGSMLPLPLSGELEQSGGVGGGGGGEDDGAAEVRAQRRRAGAFPRGRAAASAPLRPCARGPQKGARLLSPSCSRAATRRRRRGGGGGSGAVAAAATAADAAAWSPGLGRPGAFQPPDLSPAGAFAYPGWAPRSQTTVAVEATTTEQPASAPVSEPVTWPARQSVSPHRPAARWGSARRQP